MELSDSRVVQGAWWLFSYTLGYRLNMTGLDPYTINHITIRFANVLSWFISFVGFGLFFAHVSSRISPRRRRIKGLVDVLGWGFFILLNGMLAWVSITPSLTYGSVLWDWLGLLWYGGVFLMWIAFADHFALNGFYSRRLARLVPRQLKTLVKLPVPQYI